jgi:hypothetical protein
MFYAMGSAATLNPECGIHCITIYHTPGCTIQPSFGTNQCGKVASVQCTHILNEFGLVLVCLVTDLTAQA